MKRRFAVLSASLLLALATGVGTAEAGLLSGGADSTRSSGLDVSSTIDQTADVGGIAANVSPNVAVLNSGDVNQSSSSTTGTDGDGIAVNVSPNVAVLNGSGCDCQEGNVVQTSSSSAEGDGIVANVSPNVAIGNSGSVSQDSSSSAGASHGEDTAVTAVTTVIGTQSRGNDDGSPKAINAVDQTVELGAISVNASPNVAALNSGDVNQSSSAQAAGSKSTTLETLVETTIGSGTGSESCGCGLLGGRLLDVDSTIEQALDLGGIAANVSPDVAVLNGGDCGCGGGEVNQSSSALTGAGGIAANVSPNVAALNSGDVNQSSSAQAAGSKSTTLETLVETTIGSGTGSESCGCGLLGGRLLDVDSTIEQALDLGGIAANVSPNVAVLNGCLPGGCLDVGDGLPAGCGGGSDEDEDGTSSGGTDGQSNETSGHRGESIVGGFTPASGSSGPDRTGAPVSRATVATSGSKSQGVAGSGQTRKNRGSGGSALSGNQALLVAPVTIAGLLPFTGFDIASIVFGAVWLLCVGVGLCWLGRTTVLRGSRRSNERR
jgi:hypothetical protein